MHAKSAKTIPGYPQVLIILYKDLKVMKLR